MRFLARVADATGDARFRAAVDRGLDYLLAAQYPGGGWPQYFPRRDGYYSRITFNDDAMVDVLTLLRDASAGLSPLSFVDPSRRARAASAVARGTECILRAQLRQDGHLTAWCAQHHEVTLAPAWGRDYEPPTLSGSESVGVVRFLMGIERPAPEVVAAVEGGVQWLRAVAILGVRIDEFTGADGLRDLRPVSDPTVAPLWARFDEIGSHRPVFIGRDRVTRYALGEIERERRLGYRYYGGWPAPLLAEDDAGWRAGGARGRLESSP
jgi:PelA/Pel-15E family pectate lyase